MAGRPSSQSYNNITPHLFDNTCRGVYIASVRARIARPLEKEADMSEEIRQYRQMFCRGRCGKSFGVNQLWDRKLPYPANMTCGDAACVEVAPGLIAEERRLEEEEKERAKEERRRLNELGEFKRGPGRPPKEKPPVEPKPVVDRKCEWCWARLEEHVGLGRPSAYCCRGCREDASMTRAVVKAVAKRNVKRQTGQDVIKEL